MQQVSSRLTLTSDLLGAGTRCPLETSKGRHDPLLTHWVLAFLSFFKQVRKESDAHLSVHMLYFFSWRLKNSPECAPYLLASSCYHCPPTFLKKIIPRYLIFLGSLFHFANSSSHSKVSGFFRAPSPQPLLGDREQR